MMKRYLIAFQDAQHLVIVDGWDEVKKIQRDNPGRPMLIFAEGSEMKPADLASEDAAFNIANPKWKLNGGDVALEN